MNHESVNQRRRFLKAAIVGSAALGLSLTAFASDQSQTASAAAPAISKIEDVQGVYVSYRSSLFEDSKHMELPLGVWSAPIYAHGGSYRIKVDPSHWSNKYGPVFSLYLDDGSGKLLTVDLTDRATGNFTGQGLQFFLSALARPPYNN